jgi:hypothetical protein
MEGPTAATGWAVLYAFHRWDEKAGLPAGCDTLPMIEALESAFRKETGCEKG